MTENEFAMVSEWMPNGNINEFVAARQDVNRFGLVSSPFELRHSPLILDDYMVPTVNRCCERFGLYAQPGGGPRGPQRGASLKIRL